IRPRMSKEQSFRTLSIYLNLFDLRIQSGLSRADAHTIKRAGNSPCTPQREARRGKDWLNGPAGEMKS
uniref:Uncharacterized protein n=1 Tax=Chlorocebus sabaeus TaxID=60711 RepID=A0A0D9R1N5_CHLSB